MIADGATKRLPTLLAVQQLNGSAPFASVRAKDYRHCLFQVGGNAGGGLTFTAKIQESSDNSAWTDIAGASASFTNTQAMRTILVDHARAKEYTRVFITTTGNMSVCAIALQMSSKAIGGGVAPDVAITG